MAGIPEQILKELNKIPDIQGILFTGSRAIGRENKNSDWDFHLLLKDGAPRWRKTYPFGDTWIELMCNDQKQILEYFKDEAKNDRPVTANMFANGHIIQDNKHGDLRRLVLTAKKLLAKSPKKFSKEELNWINYDISTYLQDIEDCLESNNQAVLLFNYAVNEFCGYYLRLKRLWSVRAKEELGVLKELDPSFAKLVDQYLVESDWQKKGRFAIKIGRYLGKKFNLSLDGSLSLPQKKK